MIRVLISWHNFPKSASSKFLRSFGELSVFKMSESLLIPQYHQSLSRHIYRCWFELL